MIKWAGISNLDVGMVVEHYPKVIIPSRKQEVVTVPGRNGDIILNDGSFNNYDQQYAVFLDVKEQGGLEVAMPKIIDWLLGHPGYHRLEDSYFPDVYRMAQFVGGTDFSSIFNEYGEGNLVFNCCPERYFKMGEKPVVLTNGQKLFNPTSFEAKPLITVKGSGNGTLTFDEISVTINDISEFTVVDVKARRVYKNDTRLNNKFVGNFEDLYLGKETTVAWSGGITGVEIVPNWWTI